MERNSIIAERLEKTMENMLPRTSEYKQLLDELSKSQQEFMQLINSNKELFEKYLELESLVNTSHLEYESMCYCEGVRLGFKLCMDIFELV